MERKPKKKRIPPIPPAESTLAEIPGGFCWAPAEISKKIKPAPAPPKPPRIEDYGSLYNYIQALRSYRDSLYFYYGPAIEKYIEDLFNLAPMSCNRRQT